MTKEMKRVALYGEHEIQFSPPLTNDENVLKSLKLMFLKDGLSPTEDWCVSWKPLPNEMIIPLLSARDLVSMGYDPSEGDLFRRILNALRKAIAAEEVGNELIQAQIVWVKRNFPK